jgi:phosphatidylglycerophosphate synthase
MLSAARRVYVATRKKHDQLFNSHVMRPLAAVFVAAVAPTRVTPNQVTLASLGTFVAGAAMLPLLPSHEGAIASVAVLELSYLFDCADGMLARYRKSASKEGHLFDFFTDEAKALLLVVGLSLRLHRTGGYAPSSRGIELVAPMHTTFLVGGLLALLAVASSLSLTNFVRRPELSGRETPVEAHYEAEGAPPPAPGVGRWLAGKAMEFLRWANHYPSHVWAFALLDRLDVFFWLYACLNALYLGRGWLGLALRFGRFGPPPPPKGARDAPEME